MPFHQKVNTDARLTKMIDDLGITLNPDKPKPARDKKTETDQNDTDKNEAE